MAEDKNFLDSIKDKTKASIDNLKDKFKLIAGEPWPQTQSPAGDLQLLYPSYKTRGFLPTVSINPTRDFEKADKPEDPNATPPPPNSVKKKFGNYVYIDWRGHLLNLAENAGKGIGDTKDKFNISKDLPKDKSKIADSPYSTRDLYLLFSDNSTDYFRHGLQIMDNLNTIQGPEFWETQKNKETASRTSLGTYNGTPFEQNDPVIFGFDIIIDDVSSPLLNGSIKDFLDTFGGNISELAARVPIYEEFKQQFIKFFKTKATVRIDEGQTSMTKMRNSSYADAENNLNIFNSGKKAYMNNYIKKIAGIEKLVEGNTSAEKNFLVEYNKDVITLTFTEDVSLSVGTLAHLYKLLYWSRPNGKGMIPENLLRFNCEIVISEVRNLKRVVKSIETGDLQVVKDNVSRYIYSLRECQFYFNAMPHEADIDFSQATKTYDAYSITFDYKYSYLNFERFVPDETGFGKYVGYNSGAMWKIGNAGSRENATAGSRYDKSVPKFYTVGENKLQQNLYYPGGKSPLVFSIPGKSNLEYDDLKGQLQKFQSGDIQSPSNGLENFAENAKKNAKKLKQNIQDSVVGNLKKEAKAAVSTMKGLLNQTLNKILNAQGITGISPPTNLYSSENLDLRSRTFYDVRGDLLNFIGDSLGNKVLSNFQETSKTGIGGTLLTPQRPVQTNIFKQSSKTAQQLYGTSDFTQIQFPKSAQRYPAPIFKNKNFLSNAKFSKAKLLYGTSDFSQIGFPNAAQKYPSPISVNITPATGNDINDDTKN